MVHKCKMMVSGCFFCFFKIMIFRVVNGVKGQKMAQNKKFCLSHSISQEPFIIWSSFVIHNCKLIVSPGFFFIFFKFWFFLLLGGSKCKNGPKWQKTLSVVLYISGSIHHMIFIYGTHVYHFHVYHLQGIFYIFSKF